jgi:paraquat-inducible protein B
MNEASPDNTSPKGASAKVAAEKTRISIIWFIPIVAAIIGIWLVYTAISEQGPTITIEFLTGTGIEASKTKVKYKGIVVGEVESVDIKKDLSGVTVDVQMEKGADSALTDKTRFWIVKPRIAAGQVSGLSTLLSGAYIGMDPVTEGKKTRTYVGLEKPPSVLTGEPGVAFKLRSPTLASLDVGAPVYYHGVKVGRVTHYVMQDDGEILFDIFVQDTHRSYITKGTRFWNVGGIDVEMSADGIRVKTASLTSLLIGGVNFDTTESMDDIEDVKEGHTFRLFDSEQASKAGEFRLKEYYVLNFDGSIRGLEAGAPVEFRGIRIGTVTQILIKAIINDDDEASIEIPVLIAIEPERYGRDTSAGVDEYQATNGLVKRGLRASLQTGNLLTGKKYVDLEFYPDASPAELDMSGRYPAMPTVGGSVEALVVDAQILMKELSTTARRINIMLEPATDKQEAGDLAATIRALRETTEQINTDMAPEMTAILGKAEKAITDAQTMLDASGTTRTELNRLLIELAEAAKSIRTLADYIEQHPESIVFGKDE